jgi:hypothetical protein
LKHRVKKNVFAVYKILAAKIFSLFTFLLFYHRFFLQKKFEYFCQKIKVMEKGFMEQGLMTAALLGHTEIVQLFLEKGADVNAKDNDGWTALMIAAEKGHSEIVQLLLEKGADVNAKDNDGVTALMFAAANGHTEIVQLLLEKGADVNAETNDGVMVSMDGFDYCCCKMATLKSSNSSLKKGQM